MDIPKNAGGQQRFPRVTGPLLKTLFQHWYNKLIFPPIIMSPLWASRRLKAPPHKSFSGSVLVGVIPWHPPLHKFEVSPNFFLRIWLGSLCDELLPVLNLIGELWLMDWQTVCGADPSNYQFISKRHPPIEAISQTDDKVRFISIGLFKFQHYLLPLVTGVFVFLVCFQNKFVFKQLRIKKYFCAFISGTQKRLIWKVILWRSDG